MGYRRFDDREGQGWEVRDSHGSYWRFEPVGGNPARAVDVRAPGHQSDPFELSQEELQALLEERMGAFGQRPKKKSPFMND